MFKSTLSSYLIQGSSAATCTLEYEAWPDRIRVAWRELQWQFGNVAGKELEESASNRDNCVAYSVSSIVETSERALSFF